MKTEKKLDERPDGLYEEVTEVKISSRTTVPWWTLELNSSNVDALCNGRNLKFQIGSMMFLVLRVE